MPFFSVVIPLYNKENYIMRTLGSVFCQTFQDVEIIVVDDGSTDNGKAIVQTLDDSRIKLYHQKNQGASAARNYGISMAAGKWVALLDADDIWYKNHLEELHQAIERLNHADVVSNGYEIQLSPDFIKQPTYSCSMPKEALYVEDYFACSLVDSLYWTSCIAFKKAVFEDIGGFDTRLKTGQDLDLFIRFALQFKLAYNPTITVLYNRFTENNLSKAVSLKQKYKYIQKHEGTEKNNQSLKTYLDINRFSLMLQAKQTNDKPLYNQLKNEIDLKNLNQKQKVLLQLPGWVLRTMKMLQIKFIQLGIYKSAFT